MCGLCFHKRASVLETHGPWDRDYARAWVGTSEILLARHQGENNQVVCMGAQH